MFGGSGRELSVPESELDNKFVSDVIDFETNEYAIQILPISRKILGKVVSPDGKLIGLEVKAAASVTSSDFGGLRKLAEASGKRFAAGFVLYDHTQTVPFGDRLFAVPISSLWS